MARLPHDDNSCLVVVIGRDQRNGNTPNHAAVSITLTGSKNVEAFRQGDWLLSRSEFHPEGPLEAKMIEEVFVRVGLVRELRIDGQVIRTTGEHPFYVVGKGWVNAAFLESGDLLLGHDGQQRAVQSVSASDSVETVYNLRVADYHTYFVGSPEWGFSVWAHNTSPSKV